MNIHAELETAAAAARRLIAWTTAHAEHVDTIVAEAASGPVGQALTEAAEVLMPEDERMVASFIRFLAGVRRHAGAITAAPAGPQEAADGPPPVAEGDHPAPDGDGAQGGSEGRAADGANAVTA